MRPDFAAVPAAAAKELCRQGELCLAGTVQLAVGMDQRAVTQAGILGAGAVAVAAAAISLALAPGSHGALTAAAGVAALLLYAGAALCAWAARPADFHVAGYEPRTLSVCATGDDAETWMARYVAEQLQCAIDDNRRALASAAWLLGWGGAVAFAAVPAGFVTFFAAVRWFS
jgi:hypothetical protein